MMSEQLEQKVDEGENEQNTEGGFAGQVLLLVKIELADQFHYFFGILIK